MYTFRVSRHLDMFLMIHAYYHQCGYELFGAWAPGHAGAFPIDIYLSAPLDFLQKCRENCLKHAQHITILIEKVLNLEPNHIFRDSWFSLCILDSTRIQVAGLQQYPTTNIQVVVDRLKINLQALKNTKETIVLAEKSFQECCLTIRNSGLEVLLHLVDDVETRVSTHIEAPQAELGNISASIFQRYPFLQSDTPPSRDTENWNQLFSATEFITTRQPYPFEMISQPGGELTGMIEQPEMFNGWDPAYHWQIGQDMPVDVNMDVEDSAATTLIGMGIDHRNTESSQE